MLGIAQGGRDTLVHLIHGGVNSIFLAQTYLARFDVFVQGRIVRNRIKSDNSELKKGKVVRENNFPKFLQI